MILSLIILDYPVYTKPVAYDGHSVPEVLLSGHHQKIAQWREYEALKNLIKTPRSFTKKDVNYRTTNLISKN